MTDPALIRQVPGLIADLYKTTKRLEEMFQRPFTPDGHLVGSIGEVVASFIYGLELKTCSMPQIDATTNDGRTVQIKLTAGASYGFRWSNLKHPTPAALLIALQLQSRTRFVEIYNGEFPRELLEGRKDSTNGQLSISVKSLSARNHRLLPEVNPWSEFNELFAARVQLGE